MLTKYTVRITASVLIYRCTFKMTNSLLPGEKAFLNACRVWNAVDQTGRKRIMMPERPLQVQMVSVPLSKAISNAEGDRESEASSCPDDEDSE